MNCEVQSMSKFSCLGVAVFVVAVGLAAQADPPAKFQMSKEEKQLFELTNKERK